MQHQSLDSGSEHWAGNFAQLDTWFRLNTIWTGACSQKPQFLFLWFWVTHLAKVLHLSEVIGAGSFIPCYLNSEIREADDKISLFLLFFPLVPLYLFIYFLSRVLCSQGWPRTNSWPTCLQLTSTGITVMWHHAQLSFYKFCSLVSYFSLGGLSVCSIHTPQFCHFGLLKIWPSS